jgi:hypothetical protein
MMNRPYATLLILTLCLILVAACGNGGGGGEPQATTPPSTKAMVKIASTGSLGAGKMIGGIAVTVDLPAGVTIKATPDSKNTSVLVSDQGVVTTSGVTGAYAAAFATFDQTNRKVQVQVYDQNGFGVGEFVTLACDIAAGTTPAAGDFSLEGFIAKDLDGADINGLSAGLTVKLQ